MNINVFDFLVNREPWTDGALCTQVDRGDLFFPEKGEQSRPAKQIGGLHYWNVYDCRGPKVFIRQFTFSFFEAALQNADRLARGQNIDPRALFGVQRIEYGSLQDPLARTRQVVRDHLLNTRTTP